MKESKKNFWTVLLTVVRYAAAVALGAITGNPDIVTGLL